MVELKFIDDTDTDDRSNQSLAGDGESVDNNEQDEAKENTKLIRLTSSSSNIPYSSFRCQQHNEPQRRVPVLVYLALIIYLIIGSIDVTGCLLQVTGMSGHSRIYNMKLVCEIWIKSFMFLLTSFGFVRLKKETLPKRSYQLLESDEYIFLFTALGNIIQQILGLFGTIIANDILRWIWFIITILQDYLQVTFLLHANRCVRRKGKVKGKYLKWICLLLVAVNFGCWLEDSFFLFQFPVTNFDDAIIIEMSSEHKVVSDILLQFKVYYRFVSGFAFYTISKKMY